MKCVSIEWQGDKLQHSQRCYEFLFDEFKRFYLSYMFPNPFLLHHQTNSANNSSGMTPSSGRHSSITSNTSNYSGTGGTNYSMSLNVYSNLDLRNELKYFIRFFLNYSKS